MQLGVEDEDTVTSNAASPDAGSSCEEHSTGRESRLAFCRRIIYYNIGSGDVQNAMASASTHGSKNDE